MASSFSSSQDTIRFGVTWRGREHIQVDDEVQWDDWEITVPADAQIDDLLKQVKSEIQRRLKSGDNYLMGGVGDGGERGSLMKLMSSLSIARRSKGEFPLPEDLDESKVHPPDTRWSTTFATRIEVRDPGPQSRMRSLELDDGPGKRFRSLRDLGLDPDSASNKGPTCYLQVTLEVEECDPTKAMLRSSKLEDFVFPKRQKVEYVQVGTVQSADATKYNLTATTHYNLEKTISSADNPREIPRKNAIVARFPESNGGQLEEVYRITPCWEFEGRHGQPNFRIGDPERALGWSLFNIRDNGTKLWVECEKLKDEKLETAFLGELDDQRAGKGNSKWKAPRMPPMTFVGFDAASIKNDNFTKTTAAQCYVAINVMRPPKSEARHEFFPHSRYLLVPGGARVEDLEKELFRTCRARGMDVDSPDAKVRSWWIMPEGRGMSTLHGIGRKEYVAKFVGDAANRKGKVQLYMECYFEDIWKVSAIEAEE